MGCRKPQARGVEGEPGKGEESKNQGPVEVAQVPKYKRFVRPDRERRTVGKHKRGSGRSQGGACTKTTNVTSKGDRLRSGFKEGDTGSWKITVLISQ